MNVVLYGASPLPGYERPGGPFVPPPNAESGQSLTITHVGKMIGAPSRVRVVVLVEDDGTIKTKLLVDGRCVAEVEGRRQVALEVDVP